MNVYQPISITRDVQGRFLRQSESVAAVCVADVDVVYVAQEEKSAQERLEELEGRIPLPLPQMLATLDSLSAMGRDEETDLMSWLHYWRASYRQPWMEVRAC